MAKTISEICHNPLNIRFHSLINWRGQLDTPYKGFVQFKNDMMGYRAALYQLIVYMTKYGLTTPRGIISRWAPEEENDTVSYIAAVKTATWSKMILDADEPIDTIDKLEELVLRMTRVERGKVSQDAKDDIVKAEANLAATAPENIREYLVRLVSETPNKQL